MNCPNCGSTIPIRKSVRFDKADRPDECPDCGETVEGEGKSCRLEK